MPKPKTTITTKHEVEQSKQETKHEENEGVKTKTIIINEKTETTTANTYSANVLGLKAKLRRAKTQLEKYTSKVQELENQISSFNNKSNDTPAN